VANLGLPQPWRVFLTRAPDPARAGVLAESVLAAMGDDVAGRLERDHADELGALLLALCGIAPFFTPGLRRRPEWITRLIEEEDLRVPLPAEVLEQRLDAELRASPGDEEAALRRFKYYELARITLRDCRPDLVPPERSGETLTELTNLADALLRRSLVLALARVEARFGPPEWHIDDPVRSAARRLDFCVVALGKLGGGELNFSSDVDLVYVHEASPPGLQRHPERPAPGDYFTRVAQRFGTIVGALTSEGFLYRIDLDLRPSGAQGNLVVSDQALEAYFELWADTWERATFTKARPVAGGLAFGWRTLKAIDPMIYRSAMDYAAVRSIRELKDKIQTSHRAGGDGFDVKLGRGGIREVEFVAQAMQLLHGARIPQLRTRSTREALDQLARLGLVPHEQAEALQRDYLQLRRVENRLQMEGERQVHVLPRDAAGRERLARSLGYQGESGVTEFETATLACRERVHATYESVLAGSGKDGGAERVLGVFLRGNPRLVAAPATRPMMEELAERFALEIDASGEPERALNNLDRFVQGIGGRRFYYELLLDRPELVPRLAGLFSASKFLSSYVTSHPRLIEPLFDDPERLLLDRGSLRAELVALTRTEEGSERDPADVRLDGLRLFHHSQVVNVGLLDLADMIEPSEAYACLSDIAELCIEDALDFAMGQLAARHLDASDRYVVVAMGKLATRELAYGSDLDLIFLFDARSAEGGVDLAAQETFVKLTQRLISTLQTPTAEGSCYQIDARLRPSGNQGSLVTSLEAFSRYHESSAQTWERQALLRARPVAGHPELAQAFQALRLGILERPVPEDALSEIARIRQRMETEVARETPRRRNFKTGRGGVLDVESIVQALQLTYGAEHPSLLEVVPTELQLERLAELGLLDRDAAEVLRDGWRFLGRLSSRLRIVDNRSISDLDQERGDLESLARRLGYTSPGREGGARRALLIDYERYTSAIRAEYRKVFQNV
jgi:glutamate-ammonia-ligase adenylyltransferase